MTVNKDEIRKALNSATIGAWSLEGKEIWARRQQYGGENSHVWIADVTNPNNAYLVANAPEWLRALLAENAQQAEEIERLERRYSDYVALVLPELTRRDQLSAEVDVLLQRYTALRECLELFANEDNWFLTNSPDKGYLWDAGGNPIEIARAELDRKDTQPKEDDDIVRDMNAGPIPFELLEDTQGEGGQI